MLVDVLRGVVCSEPSLSLRVGSASKKAYLSEGRVAGGGAEAEAASRRGLLGESRVQLGASY